MRLLLQRSFIVVLWLLAPVTVVAEDIMIENFKAQPETRWRFFTDDVMGGVSTGTVAFLTEGDTTYARITGSVSTENNGGFIQIRMDLPDGAPEDAAGVRIVVRGNSQRYFVHLRTSGTVLPWQYYQAGFDAKEGWSELRLPFEAFERSGQLLRAVPRASSLKSIAVVAFGRDHNAKIDVSEVGFY
ncbi:CIA30 family protein [Ruegeria profundi]|uniref:NADH ubiquinone oxidoreductase n=1 Tax=Ruegeria profundi TaxID=1685378 RepID=A0A0X3U0B6_9RHOB|nr:CIA30 family protein [Ruegeria profundi]KUJ81398.1 NADH ubiquinone oxidoreductase [Ruegeria profundi]